MFKRILLFGLVVGCSVGQDVFRDNPHGAVTKTISGSPPQNTVGHKDSALQTQKSSAFDDVSGILDLNSDDPLKKSDDPRAIVFSVVNSSEKISIAGDRDLVLKYLDLRRQPVNFVGDIYVNSDHLHFMALLNLLWQYDQNPTAYQNGQRFDIDPSNVFGVLHVANSLFSRNNLGFFHALLKSFASVIFDPSSCEQRDTEGNLVLPLPYDIYHKAFPFADARLVSASFKALKKLNRADAFSDIDYRLLYMLLAPAEEKCALWRRLNTLQNLDAIDSEILSSLNDEFIKWRNFQPNQPVLQGNIVVSPTGLADNTQAIDAFFAQNPDKTLIVDFGNAKAIGDLFTVPQSITRLVIVGQQITTVGHYFLSNCRGLTTLDLSHISLTTVGDDFLLNCTRLTKLTLPDTLTKAGHCFLFGCNRLVTLDLSGTSLAAVGNGFVVKCTGLMTLIMPATLTEVGNSLAFGCSGLETLVLSQMQAEIFMHKIGAMKASNPSLRVIIQPGEQQAVQ